MSLTRRGKVTAAAATVVVLALAAVGYFAIFPSRAPAFVQDAMSRVGLAEPPPPSCPLTGQPAPHGEVPARPALAIKVENLPDARPQAGLDRADVVYEEPVEGGITRFIVVYQCHDAARVGPVRSGRTTDPKVLVQFGRPVMGYAGGQAPVVRAIDRAGLIDENYNIAISAYTRDDTRPAPHNLYTSTRSLWKAAKATEGAPHPVFSYDPEVAGPSRKARTVHLPFSSYSDVYWTWSRREGAWLRSHGTVPHVLEDGTQVRAANVVVMQVQVRTGPIVDAAGNHSPEVELTGSGKAYVFRDGRMIVGRWERARLKDVTTFVTKAGTEIALAPGVTWVELLPSTIGVQAQR
ncbi:MAG: DUF3048 domain-containing protein [Actinobacteria bacterium]|nr:MAG: DUF3048 domain-containing protein [Actinomycetota bacterium]